MVEGWQWHRGFLVLSKLVDEKVLSTSQQSPQARAKCLLGCGKRCTVQLFFPVSYSAWKKQGVLGKLLSSFLALKFMTCALEREVLGGAHLRAKSKS